APGLGDLRWHRHAQLVDQLEDGRLVEHHVVGEGQLLGAGGERFQALNEEDDVRGCDLPRRLVRAGIIVSRRRTQAGVEKRLRSAAATGSGTIPAISPPNWATSLARLLERYP